MEGSWGVGVTNNDGGGDGVEVTSLVLVGSVEGRDGDGLEGMEGSPARGSLVSVSIKSLQSAMIVRSGIS